MFVCPNCPYGWLILFRLISSSDEIDRIDVARKIVSDSAIGFMEYSEDLQTTRHGISHSFIDELDDQQAIANAIENVIVNANATANAIETAIDNGNSIFDEAAKSINVENSQTYATRSVTSKNYVQSERNGYDLRF